MRIKIVCLLKLALFAIISVTAHGAELYPVAYRYSSYNKPNCKNKFASGDLNRNGIIKKGVLNDGKVGPEKLSVGWQRLVSPLIAVEFDFGADNEFDKISIDRSNDKGKNWMIYRFLARKDRQPACDYKLFHAYRNSKEDVEKGRGFSVKFNKVKARYIKLEMYAPRSVNKAITISEIKFFGAENAGPKQASPSEFQPDHPILDKFGQYIYEDWKNKIKTDEELAEQGKKDIAWAKQIPPERPGFDRYGGLVGTREKFGLKATGFFRVEKLNGKWWFVDPEGNLFFSVGITVLNLQWPRSPIDKRENFQSEIFDDPRYQKAYDHFNNPKDKRTFFNFYVANLIRKYGDDYCPVWKKVIWARLRDWGFNSIGKWSVNYFADSKNKLPYGKVLALRWVCTKIIPKTNLVDPFDDQFESLVDKCFKKYVSEYVSDPYLMGYFIDNEPDFSHRLFGEVLSLKEKEWAVKRELFAWLEKKYSNIANFNKAWGVQLDSFSDLSSKKLKKIPSDRKGKFIKLQKEFAAHVAERYFSIVSRLIKKYDPNHLYLGASLDWRAKNHASDPALKVYGKYTDVASFDYYTSYFPEADFDNYYRCVQKPILLAEFGFGVAGRGLHYFNTPITTKAEREQLYLKFFDDILQKPYMVGTHYFMLRDQCATGTNERRKTIWRKGIVDVTDQPDEYFVKAMKEAHGNIHSRLK